MNEAKDSHYDAIIIGAGIGGLVCGCYLAKAGMKVLIAERRPNVGGCCTTFTTRGHTFDAFAHSLGGLRPGGSLEIVLRELGIKDNFKYERSNPSDIIISPDYKISFWNNLERIKEELSSLFPNEVDNIKALIDFLAFSRGAESLKLMKMTFMDLLTSYTTNKKLIALLSLPVLGNAGLPPSKISAFTATKLYQEYHFDGGYYPVGGMQSLPDLLAKCFRLFGGELLLSNEINKINVSSKSCHVKGICLDSNQKVLSNFIVSGCDFSKTIELLDNKSAISRLPLKILNSSISFFLVFFRVEKSYEYLLNQFASTNWYMMDYDLDGAYLRIVHGKIIKKNNFIIYRSPDKKGFVVSIQVPFLNKQFWKNNSRLIIQNLTLSLKEHIEGFSKIYTKNMTTLTPQSILTWTSNNDGAAFGWERSIKQFMINHYIDKTAIEGLYLTGHWTTKSFGIGGVANQARGIAKTILLSAFEDI